MDKGVAYASASISMIVATIIRLRIKGLLSGDDLKELSEHALLNLEMLQGSLPEEDHPTMELARSIVEAALTGLPSSGA
jgi:hypothetical protein